MQVKPKNSFSGIPEFHSLVSIQGLCGSLTPTPSHLLTPNPMVYLPWWS